MPGLRFWPRGLQEFLAGLWGASSCNSCSSASSSCQIREACDVETCVSTWRTQWATPLAIPRGRRLPASPAPCPASPPPHAAPSRSHPPPRLFGVSGTRGAAGLRQGRVFVGNQIPMEPMLWHWWVQVSRGQAAANHSPAFVIPTGSFKMTANPEPGGVAGAGGTVAAQPVTGLLQRVGMLRQPIVVQLPGGLSAGSQSQPSRSVIMQASQSGRRSPEGTQYSGGWGWSEGLGDSLSPGGIQ